MDCPRHTEHRYDRALNRWVGFDPRVNEWGPCKAPATKETTK